MDFFRRAPSAPLPDPAGPLWISDRIAANAWLEMGITPNALDGVRDAPDLEAMLPRPASLEIGQRVVDTSKPEKRYPGKHGLVGHMERTGIRIYTSPNHVPEGWPKPIWQIGNAEGLRWVIRSGRPSYIVADAVTVIGQSPGWASFGPSGQRVVEVLEAIGRLTREQVMAYPHTGWGEPRPAPEIGRQEYRWFCRAASFAIMLMEHRAQEVDPNAGGEYYRGCYMVYEIDEGHWLAALDAAGKAACAEAVGPALAGSDYARQTAPWRELLGT